MKKLIQPSDWCGKLKGRLKDSRVAINGNSVFVFRDCFLLEKEKRMMGFKQFRFSIFLVLYFLIFTYGISNAQVPGQMNYQGYLTDLVSGDPLDGDYAMTLTLYNEGDKAIWSETYPSVPVGNGIYNVILGQINALTPDLFENDVFLGVAVGTDDEMTPKLKLTSTPYAIKAGSADMLNGQYPSDYDQSAHIVDKDNPHEVTAAQVGAVRVDTYVSHANNTSIHQTKTTTFAELTDTAGVSQVPGLADKSDINHGHIVSNLDGIALENQIPESITRDTELSEGLDGKADTDHGHSANDITSGTIQLSKNISEPISCSPSAEGSIALTSLFNTCVCNGTKWVQTADGTSDCFWGPCSTQNPNGPCPSPDAICINGICENSCSNDYRDGWCPVDSACIEGNCASACPNDDDCDYIANIDEGNLSVDTDGDGSPDSLDLDTDNDTILDTDEADDSNVSTPPPDTDYDNIADFRDLDSDNDGILDSIEAGDSDLNTHPVDTDFDSIADFQDFDSDNDGVLDSNEPGCPSGPNRLLVDSDGDGISDYTEVENGTDPCVSE